MRQILLLISLSLLIYQDALCQYKIDTVYTSNSDSMIVRYNKKNGQIKFEEFYIKGKFVNYNVWYYRKNKYGFNKLDSQDPLNNITLTKEYNIDGHINFEKTTLHNRLNGHSKTFYVNNKIQLDCYYKNDKIDSIAKMYFENGQLWTEIMFNKDKFWEVLSNYDKNGNPIEKGTLVNGYGTRIVYDPNANILYVQHFRNGNLKKTIRTK